MKNFKKLVLLASFGLLTAQMPLLQASETQTYIEKLYASLAPRSANHFIKLVFPAALCIDAIGLGGLVLYELKDAKHSTSANIALGIGALIAASTITAKIATSTCNPIIDALHKKLTDSARKKMAEDKERIKEEFRHNEGMLCFIENPDGTHSYYKIKKMANNKYILFSLPTEAQKSRILDILQTKELPETFLKT